MDPHYPDTKTGALTAAQHLLGRVVRAKRITRDPHVAGVWEITERRGRHVVYLGGYPDPMGNPRPHTDLETMDV